MADGDNTTAHTNEKAAHIARCIGQEQARGAKALRAGDGLPSVDAISAAWLTDVLCREHPGAAVTDFRITHVSSGTHARHRLHLSYNDVGTGARLPPTLFTKSLPTVETRMISGTTMHARTEGRFYALMRPELDLEIPHCHHSHFDPESYAALHLLEDMCATKGAVFCGFETSVTRAMIEDMLGLLAVVHGHFFDDPRLSGAFKWIPPYTKWFLGGNAKLNVELSTEMTFDAAADVIPARLHARRKELWPATLAALKVHETHAPTFLHADVHIGNWYRTAAGRMGLCDWQCAARGHWSRDVAYAIAAALTVEDRRAWEKDLLRDYLARLEATSGRKFAFDESWTFYRQQMFHGLMNWTPTLCPTRHVPAMQPEAVSRAMVARLMTAIDDLESIDGVEV